MIRCVMLLSLCLGTLLPAAARAQVVKSLASPTGREDDKPAERGPETFPLAVDSAAEPRPALKYSFVPGYFDRQPGNAVPYYYRAVMALKDVGKDVWKPYNENYDRWMYKPLDETAYKEIDEFLKPFDRALKELHTAVYREECDWDWRMRDLKGTDTVYFLLDEVQESRSLARLLVLRARLEIADGRFDDAVETFKTGFQLAHDVADPPTLINDLVGIAISMMMVAEVREMIDQPGAPNMYWALASLPQPVIDMRPAMQYEMAMPAQAFPFLRDAETADHSPDEWARILARSMRDLTKINEPVDDTEESTWKMRLATSALMMKGYPRAKKELVEYGYDAEKVEAMPVAQVVAIHQARVYQEMYHAMFKWSLLPYREAQAGIRRTEEELKEKGYFGQPGQTREILPIASLLLPAVSQANSAGARINTRIAGMMALEALRMHAAANDGQLPQSLDEVTIVPVPDDPSTGQPFPYHKDGDTAVLEIPPPDGIVQLSWRLEITINDAKE